VVKMCCFHIHKSVRWWSLKTETQGFITMALYTSSNHPIKMTLKTELHSIQTAFYSTQWKISI